MSLPQSGCSFPPSCHPWSSEEILSQKRVLGGTADVAGASLQAAIRRHGHDQIVLGLLKLDPPPLAHGRSDLGSERLAALIATRNLSNATRVQLFTVPNGTERRSAIAA